MTLTDGNASIQQRRTGGASGFLRLTGVIWFIAAAIGQAAFIYFILAFYTPRTLSGDYAAWNDKLLIDGHIEGDGLGNVMFAAHVFGAALMTFGGLLQLVPQVRARLPALHRWNGRLFVIAACGLALGGLWLTWGRGTYLSLISAVAVSLNGVLILWFTIAALRLAIQRRFDDHRRWAMRAFIAVNGVWFLRVGMMAWVIGNQGPVGMNRQMSGPADIMLIFGCYLIPLAVLEVYFAAQRSASEAAKWCAGGLVLAMTGVMGLGIFGAVTLMWGPHIW